MTLFSVPIRLYNGLFINLAEFTPHQASFTLIILTAILLVIAGCNYITITMYPLLPVGLYAMAPVVGFSTLSKSLEYVAKYEELSKGMIRAWRNDPRLVDGNRKGSKVERKAHQRRTVAMRILKFGLDS